MKTFSNKSAKFLLFNLTANSFREFFYEYPTTKMRHSLISFIENRFRHALTGVPSGTPQHFGKGEDNPKGIKTHISNQIINLKQPLTILNCRVPDGTPSAHTLYLKIESL